ncbi:tRNA dihydrouridine synthase DusB [Breznakiellaceae bacterium SP9]
MSLYQPLSIGILHLAGNIFLAPLAGFTDRAFRSICIEEGADFTYTELVSSEALVRHPLEAASETAQLLRRASNEKQYAVQLFGGDPATLAKAAALLEPFAPSAVDLNAGCPVPKVLKTGAGAALMKTPAKIGHIVEGLVKASRQYLGGVPVSVKMRSGWDASSINYRECARIAVDAGAALLCLHPRTRSQGYSGTSDWSLIKDLADFNVPVVGSGDLFSPEDGQRMLRETGCAAIMFARGAQGNPFIFGQTRSLLTKGSFELPSIAEKLQTGFRQLLLLAQDIGEERACREMRKQFCAYTKARSGQHGLAFGNALRNSLVHAASIDDYRILFHNSGYETF